MLLVEVIGYVGLIAMIAFVTSLVCSMLGDSVRTWWSKPGIRN